MTKCHQVGCEHEARARFYWPGDGAKPACVQHANLAGIVARAMGFTLAIEPLEGQRDQMKCCPSCASLIICNDVKAEMHHAEPSCDWWKFVVSGGLRGPAN